MTKGKIVLLKLDGNFVNIIYNVNSQLKEHVRYEKLRKDLYMRLTKVLYRYTEYTILWYDLYKNTLKSMDFKLNPYGRCI